MRAPLSLTLLITSLLLGCDDGGGAPDTIPEDASSPNTLDASPDAEAGDPDAALIEPDVASDLRDIEVVEPDASSDVEVIEADAGAEADAEIEPDLEVEGDAAIEPDAARPTADPYAYAIPGVRYYVDAINGSDEGAGTSEDPFQSITYGLSRVSGGDALLLRDGDYGDLTFGADERGLPIPVVFEDWVTIRPDAGHAPRLSQVQIGTWSSANPGETLPFTEVGNSDLRLRLDGLIIQNTLSVHGSRYVDVRNCGLHDAGDLTELSDRSCFAAINGQHITLLNNDISHCGVGVTAMTTDFVMVGNDIHHGTHDGIKIYGGDRWLIEGNKIHDLDDGLDDDDQPYPYPNNHVDGIHMHTIIHEGGYMNPKWAGGGKDVVIRGNLFYHIESMAVMINHNDSGIDTWENYTWENNIFGPAGGRLFILGSGFDGHFIFRNNTVLFAPNDVWTSHFGREMRPEGLANPFSAQYHVQVWGNPASNRFYNNVFMSASANDLGAQDEGIISHNLFIDDPSALPYAPIEGDIQAALDAGELLGAPLPGGPADGAGSPALEAPTHDFYGQPRGSAPSIGAVEPR